MVEIEVFKHYVLNEKFESLLNSGSYQCTLYLESWSEASETKIGQSV